MPSEMMAHDDVQPEMMAHDDVQPEMMAHEEGAKLSTPTPSSANTTNDRVVSKTEDVMEPLCSVARVLGEFAASFACPEALMIDALACAARVLQLDLTSSSAGEREEGVSGGSSSAAAVGDKRKHVDSADGGKKRRVEAPTTSDATDWSRKLANEALTSLLLSGELLSVESESGVVTVTGTAEGGANESPQMRKLALRALAKTVADVVRQYEASKDRNVLQATLPALEWLLVQDSGDVHAMTHLDNAMRRLTRQTVALSALRSFVMRVCSMHASLMSRATSDDGKVAAQQDAFAGALVRAASAWADARDGEQSDLQLVRKLYEHALDALPVRRGARGGIEEARRVTRKRLVLHMLVAETLCDLGERKGASTSDAVELARIAVEHADEVIGNAEAESSEAQRATVALLRAYILLGRYEDAWRRVKLQTSLCKTASDTSGASDSASMLGARQLIERIASGLVESDSALAVEAKEVVAQWRS